MISPSLLPNGSTSQLPFISIIIPTLNEEDFIEQTLSQIDIQSYPKDHFEVFIIDGGSTDRTCELVAKWAETSNLTIKILYNLSRISSCARNIGVRAAQGEYILFIDAHVYIPSIKLVEDMARATRERGAMVLGRAQPLTPPVLTNFQEVVAGVRGSKLGHSTKSFIYSDFEGWVSPISIGAMYHHSIFDRTGYFDESFDAAEDVEFNFRLESNGYKAYMSPDFKVLYYPRRNFIDLIKQMFRYGVGRARFTNKHFNGFHYELFAPISVLLIFLGFVFSALSQNTLITFMVFILCSYVVAVLMLFKSFTVLRQLLLAPICLLLIHLGLAAGLLAGMAESLSIGKISKWNSQ